MKRSQIVYFVVSALPVAASAMSHDAGRIEIRAAQAEHSEKKANDFVNAGRYIPGLKLDIRYATNNNFTHQRVYDSAVCMLRRETAEKLLAVQKELASSGLSLKVFDCYRPLSVQKKFWSLVPDERYVADPSKGSRHNRGAAVDLTLIRISDSGELEMGTGFDDFSERAHRDYTDLPVDARSNRRKLEDVMVRHGFTGLPTEWWHFDDNDWQKYPVEDVPVGKVSAPGTK
jgi:D-alanyl-D-alanine dipeptidase